MGDGEEEAGFVRFQMTCCICTPTKAEFSNGFKKEFMNEVKKEIPERRARVGKKTTHKKVEFLFNQTIFFSFPRPTDSFSSTNNYGHSNDGGTSQEVLFNSEER